MKKDINKKYNIYFNLVLIIFFLFIFLFLINFIQIYSLNNFGYKDIDMSEVKKMQVAGSFYSANKEELDLDLEKLFQRVEVDYNNEKIKAMISPHASYYYSAETAMYGYKKLYYDLLLDSNSKEYKVIILAPAHKEYFKDISITSNKYYLTPYGPIEIIDSKLNKYNHESAHINEHSIEVQLPLLQFIFNKAKKDFKILPILVGDIDYKDLAKLIEPEIDDRTIIVVSSDLSHFLSEDKANKRDQLSINNIKEGKENIDACGKTPILALNYINNNDSNKNYNIDLLHYSTSGDKINKEINKEINKDSVVGYSSLVYTSNYKEDLLVRLSKRVIYNELYNNKMTFNNLKQILPSSYFEPKATFVTLKINNELRGCIGEIYPVLDLFNSVIANSKSAAFNDSRFLPLTKEEFINNNLVVDISLLSTPKKCDLKDISKSEGVILKQGFNKAIYLPQVWSQLPDKDDFLSSLCVKAGLNNNCYKESKTSFEKFKDK